MTPTHASDHIAYVLLSKAINLSVEPNTDSARAGHYPAAVQNQTGYRGEIGVPAWPLRTLSAYAVALHELGHLLGDQQEQTWEERAQDAAAQHGGEGRHAFSRCYLQNELNAWVWARANAQVWTADMEAEQQRCLSSYASKTRWQQQFGITYQNDTMLLGGK